MTASYCCSSMVNYTFMSSSEFTNVHIRTKFAGAHEEKRTKQQRRPVALPSMLPIFVFILHICCKHKKLAVVGQQWFPPPPPPQKK